MATEGAKKRTPTTVKFPAVRGADSRREEAPDRPASDGEPRDQHVRERVISTDNRSETPTSGDGSETIEVERRAGSGEYCFVLPPSERRKKAAKPR